MTGSDGCWTRYTIPGVAGANAAASRPLNGPAGRSSVDRKTVAPTN